MAVQCRFKYIDGSLILCLKIASEFEVKFKGSDALERRGAFYTISDVDHPITKLMQSPKKVPRGTSVLIGLNIYQV